MKTYRNRFPFKIGTTSYIIPIKEDNLVANVKFLAGSFDEVQLLFFGRHYLDEVMSPHIIQTLKGIREESGLSYSIHLPLDLDLLNPSTGMMRGSIDIIEMIMTETSPLAVEKYILHIDRSFENFLSGFLSADDMDIFEEACAAISDRLSNVAAKIYIENPAYDLTAVSEVIHKTPCRICMDAGHIFFYNQSIHEFINCFNSRIGLVHLHGHKDGRDHCAVSELDDISINSIVQFLQTYTETVIIEVFNIDDLEQSIFMLESMFHL